MIDLEIDIEIDPLIAQNLMNLMNIMNVVNLVNLMNLLVYPIS